MTPEIATAVMSAAPAALLGAGVSAWVAGKKTRPEIDNLLANASETTVSAALALAAAECDRADRAEAREREKDAKIAALQSRVETLQQLLNEVRQELYELAHSND